jgi:hypothetical protein
VLFMTTLMVTATQSIRSSLGRWQKRGRLLERLKRGFWLLADQAERFGFFGVLVTKPVTHLIDHLLTRMVVNKVHPAGRRNCHI